MVNGYSSPDGPEAHNNTLSGKRAETICDYLRTHLNVSPDLISSKGNGEDWQTVRELVESTYPTPLSKKITDVITSESDVDIRESKLRILEGGIPWRRMTRDVFPHARRCIIHIETAGKTIDVSIDAATPFDEIEVIEKPDTVTAKPNPEPHTEIQTVTDDATAIPAKESIPAPILEQSTTPFLEVEPCITPKHFVLKTNAVGWAMLVPNISVELDFSSHWSTAIPIYYSALNYFTQQIKFRTLSFRPEIQYWFGGRDCGTARKGFFIEAHAGVAWYDMAINGPYRFQDHNGNSPAIGGGLGLGYKLPIGETTPWSVEFAAGCGVYRLHYDKYPNPGHIADNQVEETKKKTAFLIDNVAISFSYTFNKKKGGGK